MPKFPDTHSPRDGTVPRRTTDKRGGAIDPEVGRPGPSPYQRKFKRGIPASTPQPEVPASKRRSGSHLENEIESDFITPPVVGPSGDSRSTQNPLK